MTCNIENCGYKTDQRQRLKDHIRGVHIKAKEVCPEVGCEYSSSYRHHLRRHQRDKHNRVIELASSSGDFGRAK